MTQPSQCECPLCHGAIYLVGRGFVELSSCVDRILACDDCQMTKADILEALRRHRPQRSRRDRRQR